MEQINNRRSTNLICVLLCAATVATFWPVFSCKFVIVDDPDYVTRNVHVAGGLTWQNMAAAFRVGYASNWHPLTWISHMLDVQLFGMRPGWHHLTSLLFHAANTVLLFLLLKQMTGALWRSALVAALFALHPLHVESVAWVSERKDVLSACFGLLALLFYARYAQKVANGESPHPASASGSRPSFPSPSVKSVPSVARPSGFNPQSAFRNPKWKIPCLSEADVRLQSVATHSTLDYGLALFFFACGLMSKPMLVTWPFVMLLLDYWPVRRFQLSASVPSVKSVPSVAKFLFPRLPSVAGTSAFSSCLPQCRLSFLLLEKVPFILLSAVSCVLTLLAQYRGGAVAHLAKVGLDQRLANSIESLAWYLWKMVWPGALASYYPIGPEPLDERVAVAGAFLVALSVVAVLFWHRRPYLMMGLLWYIGTLVPVIGIVQVGMQSRADRYTYIPLIGIFIAVVWGINEAVCGARSKTNSAPIAHLRCRRLALGIGMIVVLVAFVALTRRQIGYWKNSETLCRRALAVASPNEFMNVNLGGELVNQRRYPEALEQFAEALRINPGDSEARIGWGYVLASQGKTDEAIAAYREGLGQEGRHWPNARFLLAGALAQKGRLAEAIAEYRTALREQPDQPQALNDLAWFLATAFEPRLRNGAEAVELAERACKLTRFRQTLFVGTLAAAYAGAGRFEDAVRTAEKAIELAKAQGQEKLAEKNWQLLELYRVGKAFHEPQ